MDFESRNPPQRIRRSKSLSGPINTSPPKPFNTSKNHLDRLDVASSVEVHSTGFPELSNNLVAIAAQLTAYNQELQQRTQERDELQKLLVRLKTEVKNAKSLVQKLQWSGDKSSNEVIQYRTKLEVLQQENSVIPHDIKRIQRETEEINREKEQFRYETGQIIEEIRLQKHACNGIRNIIERAQQEVQAQQKERDKYKVQAAKAAKQASLLKDRVDEWMVANEGFIRTLSSQNQQLSRV